MKTLTTKTRKALAKCDNAAWLQDANKRITFRLGVLGALEDLGVSPQTEQANHEALTQLDAALAAEAAIPVPAVSPDPIPSEPTDELAPEPMETFAVSFLRAVKAGDASFVEEGIRILYQQGKPREAALALIWAMRQPAPKKARRKKNPAGRDFSEDVSALLNGGRHEEGGTVIVSHEAIAALGMPKRARTHYSAWTAGPIAEAADAAGFKARLRPRQMCVEFTPKA